MRGIKDPQVLAALNRVPRQLFVPSELRPMAYRDGPLPIGFGQTISQPFVVGLMSEALQLEKKHRVLEIGTGSGYQAAILGEIVAEVYSIEIVKALFARAKELLNRLGYKNIFLRAGDGFRGWPQKAPFDRVILTAAPEKIPQPLLDQLKVGGILVAPKGKHRQELIRIKKTSTGTTRESLGEVRFVPMTGQAQKETR